MQNIFARHSFEEHAPEKIAAALKEGGAAGLAALDPRAAVAYSSGAWTLRAGAGVFHQGAWRRKYQLPDGGTPADWHERAGQYLDTALDDVQIQIRVCLLAR